MRWSPSDDAPMVPVPDTGSHPSHTPKTSCRMRANQKTGMAIPRNENPVPTWSNALYCRTALKTPRRKARTPATRNEAPMSSSVAGNRSRIISDTGRVVEKLTPRSPRTAAVSHRTYWTGMGSSTPSRSR